jgi:transcriptional regulator with XRE-family HTH domain
MTELFRDRGVTQAEVARRAECGVSTLRHMQNGTGASHYGHELLTRVAVVLDLPPDQLVKAFYLPVPRDPAPPSDAEVAARLLMNQLEPYLAKIPGMQEDISGMKKDVEGMRERLQSVAHDIHQVKSQVEILLEIDHPPSAGDRHQ